MKDIIQNIMWLFHVTTDEQGVIDKGAFEECLYDVLKDHGMEDQTSLKTLITNLPYHQKNIRTNSVLSMLINNIDSVDIEELEAFLIKQIWKT